MTWTPITILVVRVVKSIALTDYNHIIIVCVKTGPFIVTINTLYTHNFHSCLAWQTMLQQSLGFLISAASKHVTTSTFPEWNKCDDSCQKHPLSCVDQFWVENIAMCRAACEDFDNVFKSFIALSGPILWWKASSHV
mgnify:CR=1 FL=1